MAKSGVAHILVDGDGFSPSQTVRAMATVGPLVIIGHGMLVELAGELGGYDAAVRFLQRLAAEVGKPVGLNVELPDGSSRTAFIGPPRWSAERLAGFIAGHHVELEEAFGDTTRLTPLADR